MKTLLSIYILAVFAFLPGSYAPFVLIGAGCHDASGTLYTPGDVWYATGTECSRFGCFNKNNMPSTFKMTCPDYPIPDCRYRLESSPDSPFPYCCIRPTCV